jgi:hypothetical protein
MSLLQLATSVAQPPWASGFIMQAWQADDTGWQPPMLALAHEDWQFAADCRQPTMISATVVDVPGHTVGLQFVPALAAARNAAHLTQLPESPPELPPLELPLPEPPLPEPELPPLELLPPSPPLPELPLLHANAAARLTPMLTLTRMFFIASPPTPTVPR